MFKVVFGILCNLFIALPSQLEIWSFNVFFLFARQNKRAQRAERRVGNLSRLEISTRFFLTPQRFHQLFHVV